MDGNLGIGASHRSTARSHHRMPRPHPIDFSVAALREVCVEGRYEFTEDVWRAYCEVSMRAAKPTASAIVCRRERMCCHLLDFKSVTVALQCKGDRNVSPIPGQPTIGSRSAIPPRRVGRKSESIYAAHDVFDPCKGPAVC